MNQKVIKDVVVRITGDGSSLKDSLGQSLADMREWSAGAKIAGGAAAAAFVAVGTALVALTRSSLDNIDALAKQSRQLGISVSAFQNMALVAEEAGVSTEALTNNLGFMQRALNELNAGTEAQVKAFGSLGLSMQDLRNLSPDEQFAKIAERLNAIQDPAQKTALSMEVFGRSGRAAINMLEGYNEALANASEFNRTFGITLSQAESDSVEAANDAVGRLSLAFEGLGNRLAVIVAPALEATANGFLDLAAAMFGAEQTGLKFFNTVSNYQAVMENFGSVEAAAALAGGWAELEAILSQSNAKEVLDDLAYAYDDLRTKTGQATSAMAGDIIALADEYPVLSQALQEMSNHADEMSAKLEEALNAGDVEAAREYTEKLGIAVENLQKAVQGADELSGIDMSGSVSWADTLAGAFWNVADAAAAAASAALSVPGAEGGGGPDALPMNTGNTDWAKTDLGFTATDKLLPPSAKGGRGGRGGGGGGGGSNPWEARLESLLSGLGTEREILENWYAESLETLRGARESELLTQEEYNQRMLQAQEKFRTSMREIDRKGFQEKASAWSGAFGDLASLMNTGNKKLFNIGKAAAIAQATIDGWSAATSAWEKGMKIGGPPVAAAFTAFSLVRTGAMIASIASQQFGGGSNATSAAGGGTVPQAETGPMGYSTFIIQGDTIGRQTGGELIREVNAAIEAGHRINMEWQPAGALG